MTVLKPWQEKKSSLRCERSTMIEFHKMHGIGNDYVFIDCFDMKIEDPSGLSKKVSDRHFGIGSDGLILIKPSDKADAFMDMYNADGSRGKMCGNGIRCVARYLYDSGKVSGTSLRIDTLSGIKNIELQIEDGSVNAVTVDMGTPVILPKNIPVDIPGDEPVIDHPVQLKEEEVRITCVSMGNPHAVIFVDDVPNAPVERIGKEIERSPLFPEGTNVEFVQIRTENYIEMRVWERGSGETMACGTGACASLVASVIAGYAKREAEISLLGGSLFIRWDIETNKVYMTGPAEYVFKGTFDSNLI
jgi:diaminopimelate epimerase